ncbi:hypothetical protein E4U22_005148 [Claviceps purpurea]|nr:hypothetical protein E4U51_002164 [Claviceps purpurea]KAG6196736.1 hypothetical protein E4U10_000732 [Claviceps purpurea]KAG6212596.1 hypothetical protein E4U35_003606 [Claviceps purpurea]KAG6218980.1 hypothetical protein E4U34_003880 [Claviceps purpurea]KAG6238224.1 hypothetical protein E4U25_001881 [Claviceps purpurea]
MVKFISVVIATLAAINPVVQAGDCTPGLDYCGHTLQEHGWQDRRLDGQELYHCESKDNVTPIKYCDYGCHDKGAGRSDTCWEGAAI